jgi:hypothetical protein
VKNKANSDVLIFKNDTKTHHARANQHHEDALEEPTCFLL